MKGMNREIRSWHIKLKNDKEIDDLAKMFNPVLQGWANYYSRYYPSVLRSVWRSLNAHLMGWVRRKYKHYAAHKDRAWKFLNKLAQARPDLFFHWRIGVLPRSSSVGAG